MFLQMVYERRIIIADDVISLSGDLLKTAVNATLTSKSGCPMLYERIGNHCLAFFSLSKTRILGMTQACVRMLQVPWPEARQFCKSIFGDLVTLNNVQDFVQVIQHIKAALLTTDFWIGGRYDMDVNSWACVAEDTPMPGFSILGREVVVMICVVLASPGPSKYGPACVSFFRLSHLVV
ncbi:uncharacterized protein LOC125045103 isoform X3 [Penaeus chinensis]|uniref:uncharacterized protein LOC125045103 isoform X3 n=1 Tax=Penaeus chinensis TaxID=139456 RepID=UPI001FB84B5F|nr:uncharacterized protein LOC125045103 isoform X3 [Penaeus chinensis]